MKNPVNPLGIVLKKHIIQSPLAWYLALIKSDISKMKSTKTCDCAKLGLEISDKSQTC
jgi:hypothetical protein